jgi:hypothetical protein
MSRKRIFISCQNVGGTNVAKFPAISVDLGQEILLGHAKHGTIGMHEPACRFNERSWRSLVGVFRDERSVAVAWKCGTKFMGEADRVLERIEIL